MIIYKLTGIRKLTGGVVVITSPKMATIASDIDIIISANFDKNAKEDYILLESITITIEIKK